MTAAADISAAGAAGDAAGGITIRPLDGRRETGAIGAIAAAVAAVTLAYAWLQPPQGQMPEMLDWQVSAFADLGPADQAIHSALLPALEEMYWSYKADGVWPAPENLAEFLVPPFYQDHFWEENGRIEWTLYSDPPADGADQGAVFYTGLNGQADGQHAWLVVINHAHLNTADSNQFVLWVHEDLDPPVPGSLKQQSLVLEGWRQVVTYSGADERARVRE